MRLLFFSVQPETGKRRGPDAGDPEIPEGLPAVQNIQGLQGAESFYRIPSGAFMDALKEEQDSSEEGTEDVKKSEEQTTVRQLMFLFKPGKKSREKKAAGGI